MPRDTMTSRCAMLAAVALLAGCGGSEPQRQHTLIDTANTTKAQLRETRAYDYFKHMLIEQVPACDASSGFVSALDALGVSCSEIAGQSPADVYTQVRAK